MPELMENVGVLEVGKDVVDWVVVAWDEFD